MDVMNYKSKEFSKLDLSGPLTDSFVIVTKMTKHARNEVAANILTAPENQ